ncbi:Elongation factor Tu GTP binding domain containing protein [Theileria equi strain WA]|uniref:Elongation factor Tu GTP binding domain containing protein n=1 Tax=Theileria equi strain WA TaxID=1537102 RepID=L0AZ01_THEEQ|nr:Elongation factor Tu GTP binding domain containing protein [Theileria equi strain WA]AFZ80246.1 Elongation factor Tu GTP binding domain containing protein [Theileria equi strain WA]|eukprot:XP_004829912.1 Elongation factor Tu GTP binding domain containing protein [Theileria equi strain WA]
MAHIDAGKTTLAESLLFASNKISRMGSVNDGTTQFDYMEQEIKRGITIRSACSSFDWNSYHINLVDTPGHTDFSGELHRALEVIDGCILVVDGTKGIQAQTKHIYGSLPKNMPRIVFVNKLDRLGVSIDYNLKSIKRHLCSDFLFLENPSYLFEDGDIKDAKISQIVEHMANFDEDIADAYLSDKAVPKKQILEKLREYVQNAKITPVLCGSALKFVGVTDLLSILCELFPHPKPEESEKSNSTTLYTFKTIPDKLPNVNSFCKVIVGTLEPKMKLFNATLSKPDSFRDSQTCKLVQAIDSIKIEDPSLIYKYDPDAIDSIVVGGFGEFHFEILAELLRDNYGIEIEIGDAKIAYKETPADVFRSSLFIDKKPEGIYFPTYINNVEKSHIGLELIIEPLEQSQVTDASSFDLISNSSNISQRCIVAVDDNIYKKYSGEISPSSELGQEVLSNIQDLLLNSLASGPILGSGMILTKITISDIKIYSSSTVAGAKFVASRVLKSIFDKGVFTLLQPIMLITVSIPNEFVGLITKDLRNNRNARIVERSVYQDGNDAQASVVAIAPLQDLLGYTRVIRSITRGNGTFTMVPNGYEPTN